MKAERVRGAWPSWSASFSPQQLVAIPAKPMTAMSLRPDQREGAPPLSAISTAGGLADDGKLDHADLETRMGTGT